MQTFESVRDTYSPAHLCLVESLLSKGMTFKGIVTSDLENVSTVTATCGEVIISSMGQVELYTENLDPYEPYDCGYHSWFLADEDMDDARMLVSTITRMTGDD